MWENGVLHGVLHEGPVLRAGVFSSVGCVFRVARVKRDFNCGYAGVTSFMERAIQIAVMPASAHKRKGLFELALCRRHLV